MPKFQPLKARYKKQYLLHFVIVADMNIVLFASIVFDVVFCSVVIILFFGVKNKRIYSLGRMYSYDEHKSQYKQTIVGYTLYLCTLLLLRPILQSLIADRGGM